MAAEQTQLRLARIKWSHKLSRILRRITAYPRNIIIGFIDPNENMIEAALGQIWWLIIVFSVWFVDCAITSRYSRLLLFHSLILCVQMLSRILYRRCVLCNDMLADDANGRHLQWWRGPYSVCQSNRAINLTNKRLTTIPQTFSKEDDDKILLDVGVNDGGGGMPITAVNCIFLCETSTLRYFNWRFETRQREAFDCILLVNRFGVTLINQWKSKEHIFFTFLH